MPISRSRKISAGFVAVLLLGGNLFAFLPAMRATRDIRRFCDGLAIGTPMAEVRSRAAVPGYRFQPVADGRVLVEHPRSLGRAYCDVAFDTRGQLTSRTADN